MRGQRTVPFWGYVITSWRVFWREGDSDVRRTWMMYGYAASSSLKSRSREIASPSRIRRVRRIIEYHVGILMGNLNASFCMLVASLLRLRLPGPADGSPPAASTNASLKGSTNSLMSDSGGRKPIICMFSATTRHSLFCRPTAAAMRAFRLYSSSTDINPKSRYPSFPSLVLRRLPRCGSAWKYPCLRIWLMEHFRPICTILSPSSHGPFSPVSHSIVSTLLVVSDPTDSGMRTSGISLYSCLNLSQLSLSMV
mmetsp:Transcript_11218/g.22552  ORF Transcript_11218/g.22552 Transcript_11218/m.22552 type:complete len:253 (-) Transcript_11218:463-1221(-)